MYPGVLSLSLPGVSLRLSVFGLEGIRHSPRYSEKIYFKVKTQEGKRLGRNIEDARREIPARILEAFEPVRPEQWQIGSSGIGSLTLRPRPPAWERRA